jgi:hypothetical protein
MIALTAGLHIGFLNESLSNFDSFEVHDLH